jgi:uncharacterized protein (DUF362 family)
LIGESSIENTGQVLQALGVAELEKQGARVINFDAEGWVSVESPLHLALQRFRVARAALDCDLIISAAKMKTHCDTGVTLSVKNLLGTISPQDRQAAHRTNIHKAIVDVYSYFHKTKKVVSVVDALYALEGRRGPITGPPVKMDLIVSGSDPLAVDSACVGIMGSEAKAIPHLALAQEHGLANVNRNKAKRRKPLVRYEREHSPVSGAYQKDEALPSVLQLCYEDIFPPSRFRFLRYRYANTGKMTAAITIMASKI